MTMGKLSHFSGCHTYNKQIAYQEGLSSLPFLLLRMQVSPNSTLVQIIKMDENSQVGREPCMVTIHSSTS